MADITPRILVTAAAGKTGRGVVSELLTRGFQVRAMVRRDDARAARLRASGAEVVVGDTNSITDVRRVLQGVQRAYWAGPVGSATLEAALLFATAAEEAKLETVVALSQWLADPGSASAHTRMEWLTDKVFSWMPSVATIFLDPGFFAENYLYTLAAAAQFGVLTLPYGKGLNAPPSNEDIAAVAAVLLADPAGHLGQRFRPTGPELVSAADVAEVMARVLGRPVRYRDIPFSFMAKAARASGFDSFTIAQLRWYSEELKRGTFAVSAPTSVVEELVGRPAESMETIVRRYHQADPASDRTPSAFLQGFTQMAKVLLTPGLNEKAYLATYQGGAALGGLSMDSAEWHAAHDHRVNGEHWPLQHTS